MLFHKTDEVKTQMSRQKSDDNKLREKHTSTVSCDGSPNSGHIQWRNPHAVVQELYNYIRRFQLEWNYLKQWNKFEKVFTLRGFGGSRLVIFWGIVSSKLKNFKKCSLNMNSLFRAAFRRFNLKALRHLRNIRPEKLNITTKPWIWNLIFLTSSRSPIIIWKSET